MYYGRVPLTSELQPPPPTLNGLKGSVAVGLRGFRLNGRGRPRPEARRKTSSRERGKSRTVGTLNQGSSKGMS